MCWQTTRKWGGISTFPVERCFFGLNIKDFKDKFPGEEWDKLDDFIRTKPPKAYLKREWFSKDTAPSMHDVFPVDYPAYFAHIPLQTEQEFNSRPLSVMSFFGRSHEGRVRVHSDIWAASSKYGYSVCDNFYHLQEFLQHEHGNRWASFHTPHFHRLDLNYILTASGFSKISLALFGAGIKTFRHSEITANSVMLTWEDNMNWAYPWVHNENCIKCKPGKEIETIQEALANPNLYEIYKAGVANWNNYQFDNYTKYLEGIING